MSDKTDAGKDTGPESGDRDETVRKRWEIVDGRLSVRHPDGTLTVPRANEIYRVAVERVADKELPPVGEDGTAAGIAFSKYPLHLEIVIETTEDEVLYPLRVGIYATNEKTLLPLADISPRAPDHVVSSGIWYPFVSGGLDEVRGVLDGAEIPGPGAITLKQYLKLRATAGDSTIIKDKSAEAAVAANVRATPDFLPPPSFSGTLFPYQKDGLRWLTVVTSQEIGGILADEMGLGKTVQIIALFAAETLDGRIPSLVVSPGTLLENWRREIKRFAPDLRILVHSGPHRTGFPDELGDNDVAITSYDTLARDLPLFRRIGWNIVVLDEAQAIKNPETRRATAAKRLPRRAGIAVTGTPVENSLRDLWSLADFTSPEVLPDRKTFEATYQDNEEGASLLEPLVSPVLLRRRVADVAGDLPERIDIPQTLELDPAQAAAYETLRLETLGKHDEGGGAVLAVLVHLRMFCAHPQLLGATRNDPALDSAKYRRLTEILEEIFELREKAIVFTSFNRMADILVADIPVRCAVPATFIDGRTPVENRQALVDVFGDVRGSALLVLNPRAAGTGLNITAANHVIHYNPEWNPAVEDQASARAWRRGQTRPVTVHRLFYADTVEETINDRLTLKRSLASGAVVGTDGQETDAEQILEALRKSPVRGGDS